MFTLIETGVGVVFGFQNEKLKGRTESGQLRHICFWLADHYRVGHG